MTELNVPVYVKVETHGSLLTDLVIGFNIVRQKFYKMALLDGKYRVIESVNKNGPWRVKNDGTSRFTPTRIVNYKYEE